MDRRENKRNRLRHRLHPMHLYCRLCDKHGAGFAKPICIWYETYMWRWLKKLIEALPDNERRC